MTAFRRDQSVCFRRLGARCFEKHQLWLGFGVFSLKRSRIPKTTELTPSNTRAELT